MKYKRIICFSAVLFASIFMIAGCSSEKDTTAQKIDGLESMGKITVVTREEGSGTRSTFAEKVNLVNKENSSNADNIRNDARIEMNADAVIKAVAEDENAIGYVSLGAVSEDQESIRVLKINEILPESTTIENNQYPLIRNFNIAYSGENTAVGTDFLMYILGAGQEVVSKNYTTVKTASTFLSDQSAGKLTITGSSSAASLLEDLAYDYNSKYNKNAEIEVQTTDSTSGLTAAMQGAAAWGMASRELKDYEKELLTYETIAKDGVAVIVNKSNPAVSLTLDQLTQIFDGTDQEWIDVNK